MVMRKLAHFIYGVIKSGKEVRGKFYSPNARFHLPVYLDEAVLAVLTAAAQRKGVEVSELANEMGRQKARPDTFFMVSDPIYSGAIQAANVLNSPHAVEMGLYVVRAFVQLRELLATNKELAAKLNELERKLSTHDQAIAGLINTIRQLMAPPPEPKKHPIGFVIPQEKDDKTRSKAAKGKR